MVLAAVICAVLVVIGMFAAPPSYNGSATSASSSASFAVEPAAAPPTAAPSPAQRAADDAKCLADLQCAVERVGASPKTECMGLVEAQAKFSARWKHSGFWDGGTLFLFSKVGWAKPDKSIITIVGDDVEFQNGFGAYSPMTYECDINLKTQKVLEARAFEGRLPPTARR